MNWISTLLAGFTDYVGDNMVAAIQWLGRPVIRFVLGCFAPLSIILGAILNPAGAVNAFICRIIDVVDVAIPATPNDYKISNMVAAMGQTVPLIGSGIIAEVFQTIGFILILIILIKVYQLIPFKMS